MMKKYIILGFLLVIGFIKVHSQSANVTEGCTPLEVKFTAPNLSAYYWEFVEGNGTATSQNPDHSFTQPGTYQVKLYEGQGNALIGLIEIKVYSKPSISFVGDNLEGCAPLAVNFTSSISIDPNLTINGYSWVFGDGMNATTPNPSHTYTKVGSFKVSLGLALNLPSCNTSFSISDYVSTNSLNVNFSTNTLGACSAPHTFDFTNHTVDEAGNIYEWDFGNGQTANTYAPGSITYTEEGEYIIELKVTGATGCIEIKKFTLNVGPAKIKLSPPEKACINTEIDFKNISLGNKFTWTFAPDPSIPVSTQRNPAVTFSSPGTKTVTFKTESQGCDSDTTFVIIIDDLNSDFTIDPEISCADPSTVNLVASNTSASSYEWTTYPIVMSIPDQASTSIDYDDVDRDSLYWNSSDTLFIQLITTNDIGCKDTTIKFFIEQKPNAHFAPSIAQGCAPLEVSFADSSYAIETIVKYSYIYGDGQTGEFTNDNSHSHTFTSPGEYYVKLIIETQSGCIDTSAGAWIKVGEPISPQFQLDKTEICLGESISVNFSNMDPRIDAFHLYTDDGRFNHCWKDKTATHIFNTLPGVYPVEGVVEYNGCYSTVSSGSITVNGAKADIGYMTDCATTHDVMFLNESTQAGAIKWTMDDSLLTFTDTFVYHFDTTGDYQVIMEAVDDITGCPSTFDTTTVFIKDIKAIFEIPDKVCDNVEYFVDGRMSIDVDEDCYKGYLWDYPSSLRPEENGLGYVTSFFPKGEQFIRLIVEDINGCTDTLIQSTESYGIEPEFTLDKTRFCLPASINTSNLTTSDTTIKKWEWSNEETTKETVFIIDENYTDTSYLFNLVVEDDLGCKDDVTIELDIYKPFSQINLDPGNAFCKGDQLTFSALDFTAEGSHLNFNWNFQGIGNYTDQLNTVTLNQNGKFPLFLYYEEEGSGCKDTLFTPIYVVDHPIANFSTGNVDLDGVICHPQDIVFTDATVFDSTGSVLWFNDGSFAGSENVGIYSFDKGEHEVIMVAQSIFGCADTISKSFTLVGPEGAVKVDKTSICAGEEITFEAVNLVDVDSYSWDFGDGVKVHNESPVKHKYDHALTTTVAKLVLKSEETGCDLALDIPFEVVDVVAKFEKIDSATFCEGYAYFINRSINADQLEWTSTQGTYHQIHPTDSIILMQYPAAGNYDISLHASSSTSTCFGDTTTEFTLDPVGDFFFVPNLFSPNGDQENDYFVAAPYDSSGLEVISYKEFRIYNRYGNLVYNNENPNQGWDGNFDGSMAPAGAYGYYMLINVKGCPAIRRRGNVTIIR